MLYVSQFTADYYRFLDMNNTIQIIVLFNYILWFSLQVGLGNRCKVPLKHFLDTTYNGKHHSF